MADAQSSESSPSAPSSSSSPSTSSPPPSSTTSTPGRPVVRAQRLASEALLNDKWDHAVSSLIVRSSLGVGFGIVLSVLLFRRRAWPVWIGLGFGAGRAWEEADVAFRTGSSTSRDTGRLTRS